MPILTTAPIAAFFSSTAFIVVASLVVTAAIAFFIYSKVTISKSPGSLKLFEFGSGSAAKPKPLPVSGPAAPVETPQSKLGTAQERRVATLIAYSAKNAEGAESAAVMSLEQLKAQIAVMDSDSVSRPLLAEYIAAREAFQVASDEVTRAHDGSD